ncbi:MAG TPA: beta-ketoacyl synthase chain length factor [Oleiagrimonas sp.]|nr:beta-ketoacyl synthase chain length factor [Oleiagrimonas sp.]
MSMSPQHKSLSVWLEGVGAWTPELPDWPTLRDWLRGAPAPGVEAVDKPRPTVLSASARRRAPRSVLAAVDVASQAVAMTHRDASRVPSLFATAQGDSGIVDSICATLATHPGELSPTRFHNSVHNAAAGYWTMATGCHAASSALTAFGYTFAAGLLEAASTAHAQSTPLLMVSYDVPGCGPLTEILATKTPFACALLVAAERSERAVARADIQLVRHVERDALAGRAGQLAANNVSARGIGLLQSLALRRSGVLYLQVAPQIDLKICMEHHP